MTRVIQLLFVCPFLLPAQTPVPVVTSKYHFTTAQTSESLTEAATLIRSVASITQVAVDDANAMLTFSGPAEAVDFAAWILPRIDKTAGHGDIIQEYKLTKDVGRVNFLQNIRKPQETGELITALRVVADIQKISVLTSNHALVMRDQDWAISFGEWIIEQLDQPVMEKPAAATREFMVGGPDYRGLGHGARVIFLANPTSPMHMQEILTVLRTVSDVQKIFNYNPSHALVLRAGDTDLKRAEWIIQQLDLPTRQPSGNRTFAAPAGDDITRVFPLSETTPQWIQSAVTSLRSEYNLKKIFPTTEPANIVVRGTSDQIAATATWMAAHNALTE